MLKLKCDILLSNLAFKFNVRRYTPDLAHAMAALMPPDAGAALKAGAYTRPLFSST